MTAAQLLDDLARAGISIEVHEDRLRYSPRSAMTPGLIEQMKSHKDELLKILRKKPVEAAVDLANVKAVWQAALDLLEGDPQFPPDHMEALRSADVRWVTDSQDGPGEPLEVGAEE